MLSADMPCKPCNFLSKKKTLITTNYGENCKLLYSNKFHGYI